MVSEETNVSESSLVGPLSWTRSTTAMGEFVFLDATSSSLAPGPRFVKRIWRERSRVVWPRLGGGLVS